MCTAPFLRGSGGPENLSILLQLHPSGSWGSMDTRARASLQSPSSGSGSESLLHSLTWLDKLPAGLRMSGAPLGIIPPLRHFFVTCRGCGLFPAPACGGCSDSQCNILSGSLLSFHPQFSILQPATLSTPNRISSVAPQMSSPSPLTSHSESTFLNVFVSSCLWTILRSLQAWLAER